MVCEMVLEEEGVFGSLAIGELHLDLIPLDDDLLSLEMDHSFKDLFVDGDTSCIYALAKAIMKLQTVYGIIPNVVGKGYLAKVCALREKMRNEVIYVHLHCLLITYLYYCY